MPRAALAVVNSCALLCCALHARTHAAGSVKLTLSQELFAGIGNFTVADVSFAAGATQCALLPPRRSAPLRPCMGCRC
jgi:hypothetical protein